jgi:hypothetical protein
MLCHYHGAITKPGNIRGNDEALPSTKQTTPMKKLWIVPAVLLILAIVICLLDIGAVKDTQNNAAENNEPAAISSHDRAPTPVRQNEAQPDDRLARLPDGHVEYKPALATSRAVRTATPPKEALALIEQLLGHYRYAYKENPVGVENFEITEQLLGKNPNKIVFIALDSEALRGNELIDQWGTPYFFHALSGQQMDIRSAGPDQTLWTADDVFLNQQQ